MKIIGTALAAIAGAAMSITPPPAPVSTSQVAKKRRSRVKSLEEYIGSPAYHKNKNRKKLSGIKGLRP